MGIIGVLVSLLLAEGFRDLAEDYGEPPRRKPVEHGHHYGRAGVLHAVHDLFTDNISGGVPILGALDERGQIGCEVLECV